MYGVQLPLHALAAWILDLTSSALIQLSQHVIINVEGLKENEVQRVSVHIIVLHQVLNELHTLYVPSIFSRSLSSKTSLL